MTPLDLAILCQRSYNEEPTFVHGDTEVLVTEDEHNATTFTFRGTTFDGMDILQDLRTIPWWSWELQCWCHKGFLLGVRGIWPMIAEPLSRIAGPVIFNGHSKGGGEAVIGSAFKKKLLGQGPTRLETCGCPRAGFPGLCDITSRFPGNRWVLGIDGVTKVPLPGPYIFRYRHDRDEGFLKTENEHLFHNHRIAEYIEAHGGPVA